MIDRLSGVIVRKCPGSAVIEVGGVGFRVDIPALSLRDLPVEGKEATIFTYLDVKEDALQLYGFAGEDERALFTLLISVSKVGPRLALAVLSTYRPGEVARALVAGDVRALSAVSGLGKKTAERLVVELKDKVAERWSGDLGGQDDSQPETASSADPDTMSLARAALQELGMSVAEAEHALRDASAEDTVQTLVRRALTRRP